MQRDLLDFIFLTSGKLLRIPLAVISASLLARQIGPDGLGQWAMILAVTHLFHSFLFSWTQSANVRFGREEWNLENKLSDIWAARWPLIGIGMGLATVLLIVQPFSILERFFNLSASWWPYILVFVFGQWFLSESQSLFRVTEKIGWLTIIPILPEVATILFLFTLFLLPSNTSLNFVLSGMILITTVISGIAWIKEFLSSRSLGGKSNMEERKKIIRYSWPLLPGLLFAYLSNWGDHVLLQYFRSTKEVGFFSAGYQVMQALMGIASSISILLLPKLIDKKLSEPSVEQDYLKRIGPTIVSMWLLIIIPVLALVPWVFTLIFGNQFVNGIPILLVLCAAIPCSIFSAVYAILFEIQGRLGKASFFSAIQLVLNFAISFALVVQFGAVGVALGTMVSYFLTQLLYILDQHRFLGVPKEKVMVFLIFSILYGLMQITMGDDLGYRIGGAFLGFSCLILIIRQYKMVDKVLIENLLSGKLSGFLPHFNRILIRN